MRRSWLYGLVLLAVLGAGLAAWRISQPAAAPEAAAAPAALVTVIPVRAGSVNVTIAAYGVVAGSASASRTISAPRGVIVQRVLVTSGQWVQAGAPLMVLANSPASALAWRQASDATRFAELDLQRIQRLAADHLAANDQVGVARKALADAKAALASQTAAGATVGDQTLTAPAPGVVGMLNVTPGARVAADALLLTLIPVGGMVAQLGVDPESAARLSQGQDAWLSSPFAGAPAVRGRVSQVGRQVDPTTHLVTVAVPVTGMALGEAVTGRITVSSHWGLLAPRHAVAYDEDGAHVFVIEGGKARAVSVKPGAEQGSDVEIAGDLKPGQLLAVSGAFQLQDGMAVRTARQ